MVLKKNATLTSFVILGLSVVVPSAAAAPSDTFASYDFDDPENSMLFNDSNDHFKDLDPTELFVGDNAFGNNEEVQTVLLPALRGKGFSQMKKEPAFKRNTVVKPRAGRKKRKTNTAANALPGGLKGDFFENYSTGDASFPAHGGKQLQSLQYAFSYLNYFGLQCHLDNSFTKFSLNEYYDRAEKAYLEFTGTYAPEMVCTINDIRHCMNEILVATNVEAVTEFWENALMCKEKLVKGKRRRPISLSESDIENESITNEKMASISNSNSKDKQILEQVEGVIWNNQDSFKHIVSNFV